MGRLCFTNQRHKQYYFYLNLVLAFDRIVISILWFIQNNMADATFQ